MKYTGMALKIFSLDHAKLQVVCYKKLHQAGYTDTEKQGLFGVTGIGAPAGKGNPQLPQDLGIRSRDLARDPCFLFRFSRASGRASTGGPTCHTPDKLDPQS